MVSFSAVLAFCKGSVPNWRLTVGLEVFVFLPVLTARGSRHRTDAGLCLGPSRARGGFQRWCACMTGLLLLLLLLRDLHLLQDQGLPAAALLRWHLQVLESPGSLVGSSCGELLDSWC